jgi:hypothetical protein
LARPQYEARARDQVVFAFFAFFFFFAMTWFPWLRVELSAGMNSSFVAGVSVPWALVPLTANEDATRRAVPQLENRK